MTINNSLELLKSYSGPFELTLHPGADEALIKRVEYTYGITLPDDFKILYRFSDGFEIDEDILNMIPLQEMISNKEKNEPIWIAEYMIYCDMWGVEINPKIPNDYSISDGDKIILTNSLAEFIERMLKGGVFEKGGLYHWAGKIKAKTYGNTNPNDIKPILSVFREGVKLDLISKEKIINYADWIISTEENPDRFFIELSLCRDLNEIVGVLNSVNLTEDILQTRVIFGEVYLQLLIAKIATDKVLSILIKFVNRTEFTSYETKEMMYLVRKWRSPGRYFTKSSQKKFDDHVKTFSGNYSSFYLYDCENWDEINSEIIKNFSTKKQKGTGFFGSVSQWFQKFSA